MSFRVTMAAILFAAAVQAATINTTLTVTGAAITQLSGSRVSLNGIPCTLSNIGTCAFSAVGPSTPGTLNLAYTLLLVPSGGTITGVIAIPAAVLSGGSGTGSATVTGGTGAYSGASGLFPSLAVSGTSSGTLNITGAGTITAGAATVPSIAQVQNNYSYLVPGLPNYGIAPGSLFIVQGALLNDQPLSDLQRSDLGSGIPTTLNGTSISVTVNGATVTPGIYYTSPSQLAAVLPSNTPVGTGTISVSNNGRTSAPAPILVVPSALGFDTLYGTGTGLAVAQDFKFNLLGFNNPATPGQTVILWGSGIGPDPSNDDRKYPLNQNNLSTIPFQIFIGGIQASVSYRGRSQYPGVDQVVVSVPPNVPLGCYVSVIAVSGNVSSNAVAIPVSADGGPCSDLNAPLSPSLAQQLSGKSAVKLGTLVLGADNSSETLSNPGAVALFAATPSGQNGALTGTAFPSLGSCMVIPQPPPPNGTNVATGLDAGTITVTGPSESETLSQNPQNLGLYNVGLNTIPPAGGTFSFRGAGGKDVGSFSVSVSTGNPLVWTNLAAITTVNRSQGVTVNWTGGVAGTFVTIGGSSTAKVGGQSVLAAFTCTAPVSALQFTVPSAVLDALPAGDGTLTLGNSTLPQGFTASGLDFGYATATVGSRTNVVYQ